MENLLIVWAITLAVLTYFIAKCRELSKQNAVLTAERNHLFDRKLKEQGMPAVYEKKQNIVEPDPIKPFIGGKKSEWLADDRKSNGVQLPDAVKAALMEDLTR